MNIKDIIRTHPKLFDNLKKVKRVFSGETDPAYVFLNSYSKSLGRPAVFIQIGANDGLRNDPVREFVVRDKWNGVLIEPLPDVFELLKKNYANLDNDLVFLCCAVSKREGEPMSFYTFEEDFLKTLSLEDNLDYLRKASFDYSHVKRFLKENIPETVIKKIEVPVTTVNEIVSTYMKNRPVDIIVIDAEGYESDIINGIDLSEIQPGLIFFESHHIDSEKRTLFEYLVSKGYDIKEIGGDTAAILK